MKNIQHQGYRVYAGAPKNDYLTKISAKGIKTFDIPIVQTGTNPFEELYTVVRLSIAFLKVKPDIIHLFSVKAIVWGGLAARLCRNSAVVSTFTGMGF